MRSCIYAHGCIHVHVRNWCICTIFIQYLYLPESRISASTPVQVFSWPTRAHTNKVTHTRIYIHTNTRQSLCEHISTRILCIPQNSNFDKNWQFLTRGQGLRTKAVFACNFAVYLKCYIRYIHIHVNVKYPKEKQSLVRVRWRASTFNDDDCFYYHSWRNNVVIAFGTLSSFLT